MTARVDNVGGSDGSIPGTGTGVVLNAVQDTTGSHITLVACHGYKHLSWYKTSAVLRSVAYWACGRTDFKRALFFSVNIPNR